MARSAAVANQEKETLWGLITSIAGYIAWGFIWGFFFWAGSVSTLIHLGFDQVPRGSWLGLVVVDTLVTIPVSCQFSKWFTEFKEWAKKKEL